MLTWCLRKSISFKTPKDMRSTGLLFLLLLLQGVEANPGPSHEESRNKVCGVCYLKSTDSVNAEQETLIRTHVDSAYDSNHLGFPNGICNKCRCKLSRKNKVERSEKQEEYALLGKSKWLRSKTDQNCTCAICKIAKSNGHDYKKLSAEILSKKKPVKKHRLCPDCLSALYPGCKHICTKTQRKSNIKGLSDDTTKEEIANEVLKSKLEEVNNGQSQLIKLRSLGRPSYFQ